MSVDIFKNEETDKIWWHSDTEEKGSFVFSFDKKHTFNLFRDYPWKLTKKQKAIFDAENPFWVEFFADRQEGATNGKDGNTDVSDH